MAELSAGILMWRRSATGAVEVLLDHFGGPLWARRDAGAWAIPKGLASRARIWRPAPAASSRRSLA